MVIVKCANRSCQSKDPRLSHHFEIVDVKIEIEINVGSLLSNFSGPASGADRHVQFWYKFLERLSWALLLQCLISESDGRRKNPCKKPVLIIEHADWLVARATVSRLFSDSSAVRSFAREIWVFALLAAAIKCWLSRRLCLLDLLVQCNNEQNLRWSVVGRLRQSRCGLFYTSVFTANSRDSIDSNSTQLNSTSLNGRRCEHLNVRI